MRQPKRAPALISNKPGTLSSVRWRREPTSGSTPLAYGPDREAHRREWVKVTRSLHDALEETLGARSPGSRSDGSPCCAEARGRCRDCANCALSLWGPGAKTASYSARAYAHWVKSGDQPE